MKPILSALLFLLAVSFAAAQSLKSQIEALDKKAVKAFLARDGAAFEKAMKPWVTADFKQIENGKVSSFKEMCQGMTMMLAGMQKVTRAEAKLLSLKEKGNAATAVSRHTMEGVMAGPDSKTMTTTFVGKSTDTYVKQGGKWKISKMVWTPEKMLVDGKPVNMGG